MQGSEQGVQVALLLVGKTTTQSQEGCCAVAEGGTGFL